VQVLDPDGIGSINFVQFSEGVKRILELQGSHFHCLYWITYTCLCCIIPGTAWPTGVAHSKIMCVVFVLYVVGRAS